MICKILRNKKISRKWIIPKASWVVFNAVKTFHSPGGVMPQYLSNLLNSIFEFSTTKYTIPALGIVLYSSGTSISWTLLLQKSWWDMTKPKTSVCAALEGRSDISNLWVLPEWWFISFLSKKVFWFLFFGCVFLFQMAWFQTLSYPFNDYGLLYKSKL